MNSTAGSSNFVSLKKKNDKVYGDYIDNTDVGNIVKLLLSSY